MEIRSVGMGAVPDAKPNSPYPRWAQNLVGGVSLVAIISVAVTWGALGNRVDNVEKQITVVQETKEKVAVIENEVQHIKEDVEEVKDDVKIILEEVRKINHGGGN